MLPTSREAQMEEEMENRCKASLELLKSREKKQMDQAIKDIPAMLSDVVSALQDVERVIFDLVTIQAADYLSGLAYLIRQEDGPDIDESLMDEVKRVKASNIQRQRALDRKQP